MKVYLNSYVNGDSLMVWGLVIMVMYIIIKRKYNNNMIVI